MKRTPLNRGTKGLSRGKPLERGAPLARSSGLAPGKPLERRSELKSTTGLQQGDKGLERTGGLAPRSKSRQKQMKEDRIPLIESLVAAGVTCEISMVFEELGIAHHCQHAISGMHERRKSSSGGTRTNIQNLVPACSWCNGYIEDAVGAHRALIEGSYLVVREGHPEWDLLSKRNDRLDP